MAAAAGAELVAEEEDDEEAAMVGKETRVLGLGLGVLGFWKREDGEAGRRREEDAIVEEERETDRAEMKVNGDQPKGERERERRQ